ncbi:MAG: beta-hydroxyacyl-ACP dehydratase [Desulfobulbus propionicus]|nr:MAG: beta-hydroxyacyl-ACP dehydratase [Desulfobulbus propionicus]
MEARGQEYLHKRIPHREPFLWLDTILEIDERCILAQKYIDPELAIFKGHYPEYPLMPGVILCEAVFQAGAVFISEALANAAAEDEAALAGVPVLTRILSAKFKREVKPGDTITIRAALKERLANAWFLKGSVKVGGKTAVQVEFACALKGAE